MKHNFPKGYVLVDKRGSAVSMWTDNETYIRYVLSCIPDDDLVYYEMKLVGEDQCCCGLREAGLASVQSGGWLRPLGAG